jgi:outer membrane biosynthesis protein TonB
MLKNSTISISLFLALACGQAPAVVQNDVQDLPVSDLNYIDIGSPQEEPPTDNPSFNRIENPVDTTEQEEPAEEEQPVEEEQPEEQPIEEEQPEEEPIEEEQQPEEEPIEEEEQPEEQPEEETPFSGECDLEGNVYNFNSICISPQICVSRHQDNFQVIPETGFCAKYCMGHMNCPSGVCVINGITPGVGYCEE